MSVINRMLSDLERRGAPTELHSDPAMIGDSPRIRGRWRTRLARVFPAGLAVVLLAIAAVLWVERGPRLLAGLNRSGPPAAAAEPAVAPALIGIAFEGEATRPRLVLQLDRPLERAPRYTRSGAHAALSLAARLDQPSLPAPPAAQQVFRGLTLDPAAEGGIRLQLDLAPAAGLELRTTGDRVVLAGRLPESVATTGVDESRAAAGEEAAQAAAAAAQPRDTESAAADTEREIEGQRQTAAASASAAAGERAAAPAANHADPEPATAAGQTEQAPAPRVQASAPAEPARSERTVADSSATGSGSDGAGTQSVRKSQSMSPEMRARRRYRDGRRALGDGKLSEARRLLGVALELDPALHAARDLLVSLARRAGETDTARALLIEGAERAPQRLQYAMPLARLLVDVGELDRAAGVLARARAAGTGNARYHALTAAVAQRRGRHEQAAREYTRALEIDADNGLWWLGLGVSLAASGHPDEARAALREARASGDLSEGLDRWAEGRIDQLGGGREG